LEETKIMPIRDAFISEIENESKSARAMLERIPAETFEWKPHEKSMSMGQLATLVADMFGWFVFELEHEELDFAKPYDITKPQTTEELVKMLDDKLHAAVESFRKAEDRIFGEMWKLRTGDQIHMELSKLDIVRQTINHLVHHRGQLSVYLRLKDIPVPSIYGPSADEGQM
jgi:uncharacterized damage-inducible protein DinB